MRRKEVFTALAVAGSLALAPLALAGEQYDQKPQTEQRMGQTQTQAGAQGVAAEDLMGAKIKDQQGQEIGSVSQVILDPQQGQVAYLVVSSEAADQDVIVPWNAVQFQQTEQQEEPTLALNISQDQLNQAPQGEVENLITDREKGRQIHQFYGVSPYWEEGQMQRDQQQMQQMQQPAPILPPDHPPVLPPDHPPVTPQGQMPPQGERM